MMEQIDPSIGDQWHGFTFKKIQEIPKIKTTYYLLEHETTKTPWLHLKTEDNNNCFAVGLKTTPKDSTGVAHILEHSVLCGSKKYPVKDPFFAMGQRSLNNFMNAMTASDWTLYPFSTQNEKDFYNLMDVYLDAVFFPILDPLSFKQEGHRLEFENPSDPQTPLVVKGIVYNEMKGALSSPASLGTRYLMNGLYPTTTYHYNSGGDPQEIINLTYEEFKHFHEFFYHPSNGFFYSYGNFSLKNQLKCVNDTVLKHFSYRTPPTTIADEQRFSSPQKKTYYYPLSQEEDDGAKHHVSLSWLLGKTTNAQEILSLQLLVTLLLGHAGAPLPRYLLESKLGKSLSDQSGFHDDLRETFFSIGLQGVKEEHAQDVEALIMSILTKVAKEGFSEEEIESAFHQIELREREIGENFGLDLLFRFFGPWIHGGDPLQVLDIDHELSGLEHDLKNIPRFLEKLVERFFLKNPHRLTMTLCPDHQMRQRLDDELAQKLLEQKKKLSEEEAKAIVQMAAQLKEHQEKVSPVHLLPKIVVSDLSRSIPKEHLPFVKKNQMALYDRPTNGLFYLTVLFPIDHLSKEQLRLLPFVSTLLTQSGTLDKSYEKVAQQMARFTGGIGASPLVLSSIDSKAAPSLMFEVSTSGLKRSLKQTFELLTEILTKWSFLDVDRTQTLLKKRVHNLRQSIASQGHSYARSKALSSFSLSHSFNEELRGIQQYHFISDLEKRFQQSSDEVIELCQSLPTTLFSKDLHFVLVGDHETLKEGEQLYTDFVSAFKKQALSQKSTDLFTLPTDPLFKKELWTTTTAVSYVARLFQAPDYRDPDAALFRVAAPLVSHKYFHTEIREKGGAYGGGCSYSSLMAYFAMTSYRDPQLAKTYDVYDHFLSWLKNYEFSAQDLEEGIIQIVADLDSPSTPADEAIDHYHYQLQGLTSFERQVARDRLFDIKVSDIKPTLLKWLVDKPHSDVAVTSSEMSKEEKLQNYQVRPIS